MSEAMAVPESRVLAALSASEMAQTQQQLRGWCLSKLRSLAAEYREQRENFNVAKAAKWKTSAWENAMRKTKRKLVFYGKVFAAVKAGYVIVPNFDAEVMAVRVNRGSPRHQTSYHPSNLRAQPDKSPAGTGVYVDDTLYPRDLSYRENVTGKPGETRLVQLFKGDDFDTDIDFPIAVVKPIVMDATQRAMGLRIFDEIAVAGAPRKDPMVLGRVLGDNHQKITFFIAWWLDLETL